MQYNHRVQLVLSVNNMNTSVSGRESLNGAAEPGRDLLEIDVFDVTKSVRAKNRDKSASRQQVCAAEDSCPVPHPGNRRVGEISRREASTESPITTVSSIHNKPANSFHPIRYNKNRESGRKSHQRGGFLSFMADLPAR